MNYNNFLYSEVMSLADEASVWTLLVLFPVFALSIVTRTYSIDYSTISYLMQTFITYFNVIVGLPLNYDNFVL